MTVLAAQALAEPQMSWLDNGKIRLGADLAIGGAITWLSRSGSEENVINSHDWGRQVQMSYYGGPVPFVFGDKRPAKYWEGLGWNPIQAGDDFGHGSRVLEHRNDGQTLYVKCVPMQWPLDDVPGDCTFESWLELDGSAVRARCRLTNARADRTQYPARGQELPAVYTNAPFHRIVTCTGEGIRTIEPKGPPEWTHWLATEGWSALVNDAGWGLGVWNPGCVRFVGGFNGKPGAGGAKDDACGYLAPQRLEILDHNIVHEYRYDLVLGTLEGIRAHVLARTSHELPAWRFASDRQGWHYVQATDGGWPVRGELAARFTGDDPQLFSPAFFCHAEDAPVLVIDVAFRSHGKTAHVFWTTLAEEKTSPERVLSFPVMGDGEFREYRVRLADAPGYRGGVTSLRIDPPGGEGDSVRVRAVRLEH